MNLYQLKFIDDVILKKKKKIIDDVVLKSYIINQSNKILKSEFWISNLNFFFKKNFESNMLIFSPRTRKKKKRQKLKFPATRENRVHAFTVQTTVGHNFTNPPYPSPFPLRSVSTTHQSPVPPLIFKFTIPLYSQTSSHKFSLSTNPKSIWTHSHSNGRPIWPSTLTFFCRRGISLSLSLCML